MSIVALVQLCLRDNDVCRQYIFKSVASVAMSCCRPYSGFKPVLMVFISLWLTRSPNHRQRVGTGGSQCCNKL